MVLAAVAMSVRDCSCHNGQRATTFYEAVMLPSIRLGCERRLHSFPEWPDVHMDDFVAKEKDYRHSAHKFASGCVLPERERVAKKFRIIEENIQNG